MRGRGWSHDDLWMIAFLAVVVAAAALLWIGPPDVSLKADRFETSATCVPLGHGDAMCGAPGKPLFEHRAVGHQRPDASGGDMIAR